MLDETCRWCAKPFETTRTDKLFCSKACRRAAEYERWHGWRAEARAAVVCQDCGAAIVDARKSNRQACAECQRKRGREATRRYRRRLKAEGRLGWRAEARKSTVCQDCGSAIVGALRYDQKRCDECRREHKRRLANCKRCRQRTKAGTNGKRGTNQFARVE